MHYPAAAKTRFAHSVLVDGESKAAAFREHINPNHKNPRLGAYKLWHRSSFQPIREEVELEARNSKTNLHKQLQKNSIEAATLLGDIIADDKATVTQQLKACSIVLKGYQQGPINDRARSYTVYK